MDHRVEATRCPRSASPLTWAAALLALCGSGGCAARSPGALQRDVVRLTAHALEGEGTRWQAVPSGATLRSGARLRLTVAVGQPLYLYVVHFGPPAAALFSEVRVHPEAPLDLPQGGAWLRLGDRSGVEDLRVLLSKDPLSEAAVLLRVAAPLALGSRDPPPIIREKDRESHAIYGNLNAQSTVLLRLLVHHQR